MPLYDGFAQVYARGAYPAFARRVSELLPAVLARFGVRPQRVLDVACGEGTFAVAMARLGATVCAVDASPRMVELARRRAQDEGVAIEVSLSDMRSLPFSEEFDLVTCWYDSLNYLLEESGVREAFEAASRALVRGGVYAFDVNTVWGLGVNWLRSGCTVKHDDDEVFEVHRCSYDPASCVATLHVTALVREGEWWRRVDETHRERGYRREVVSRLLRDVGFEELGVWSSLRDLSPPRPESGRLFFLARKPSRG